jgi:hypothetical protein
VVVYASDGWTFDFVNNHLIWFFFLNFRIKEKPVPDFGGKIKFTNCQIWLFQNPQRTCGFHEAWRLYWIVEMSNPPQFNLFACGDSFLEDSGTEETCISE